MIILDIHKDYFEDKNSIEISDNGKVSINIKEQNLVKIFKKPENYSKSFFVSLNNCFRKQSIEYYDEMLSLKCDEFVNIAINIFDIETIYINGIISSKLERQKKTNTNVK